MSVAVQQSFIDAGDWKSSFLSFISNRLDELESNFSMEFITDISKSLFQNRSEIMGQAALALIEKKFGHLLGQCLLRVSALPSADKGAVREGPA